MKVSGLRRYTRKRTLTADGGAGDTPTRFFTQNTMPLCRLRLFFHNIWDTCGVRHSVADFVLAQQDFVHTVCGFRPCPWGKDFVTCTPCLSATRALGRCSSSLHGKRYPAAPDDILTCGQDDILLCKTISSLREDGKKPRHRIGARAFLYLLLKLET